MSLGEVTEGEFMIALLIVFFYVVVTIGMAGVSFLVDYFFFVGMKVTYRLGYVFAVSLLMSVLMPIGFILFLWEQVGFVTFLIIKLIVRPLFKTYLYRKVSKAPKRKVLAMAFFSELIVAALLVLIASRIA